jgi:hypothetical protein
MRHRLRNRIIIRCLSSGETGRGTARPDDADVKPGVAQPYVWCDALKLGVTRCAPT